MISRIKSGQVTTGLISRVGLGLSGYTSTCLTWGWQVIWVEITVAR